MDKASAATATLFQNECVPVIKTDATNAQTEQKQCTSSETKKEVAHLTNLDIGKTYIARTLLNDQTLKTTFTSSRENQLLTNGS